MVGQLDLDVATEQDHGLADALRFAELTDRTAAGRPTPDEFFDFGFDMLLFGLHDARSIATLDDQRRAAENTR